jgi:hypothetical protein
MAYKLCHFCALTLTPLFDFSGNSLIPNSQPSHFVSATSPSKGIPCNTQQDHFTCCSPLHQLQLFVENPFPRHSYQPGSCMRKNSDTQGQDAIFQPCASPTLLPILAITSGLRIAHVYNHSTVDVRLYVLHYAVGCAGIARAIRDMRDLQPSKSRAGSLIIHQCSWNHESWSTGFKGYLASIDNLDNINMETVWIPYMSKYYS